CASSALRRGPARTELDDMQLEALSKLFTERSVFPGQFWCREGEPAHTLAIILVGHLAVQNDDSILRPGDIVGDRELCGQHIWSSSVRGVEPSLLAEIDFQVLSQFIEGMGLKKARRLSKIIADNVLERVKEEKARLEEQVHMKCLLSPIPLVWLPTHEGGC
ncbi:MAG: cyclic nucleotide-binding domain-containing protein, partial [bacterium]